MKEITLNVDRCLCKSSVISQSTDDTDDQKLDVSQKKKKNMTPAWTVLNRLFLWTAADLQDSSCVTDRRNDIVSFKDMSFTRQQQFTTLNVKISVNVKSCDLISRYKSTVFQYERLNDKRSHTKYKSSQSEKCRYIESGNPETSDEDRQTLQMRNNLHRQPHHTHTHHDGINVTSSSLMYGKAFPYESPYLVSLRGLRRLHSHKLF